MAYTRRHTSGASRGDRAELAKVGFVARRTRPTHPGLSVADHLRFGAHTIVRNTTPIDDSSFTAEHLTLEDLVLAYMSWADPDPLPALETTR